MDEKQQACHKSDLKKINALWKLAESCQITGFLYAVIYPAQQALESINWAQERKECKGDTREERKRLPESPMKMFPLPTPPPPRVSIYLAAAACSESKMDVFQKMPGVYYKKVILFSQITN